MHTEKITRAETANVSGAVGVSGGNAPFGQGKGYLPALAVVLVCFALPLYRWMAYAVHDDLYSYVLLLPFVCWYLVRLKPPTAPPSSKPLSGVGVALLVVGAAAALACLFTGTAFGAGEAEDYFSANLLAFYLCFLGVHFLFLGRATLNVLAFPLGILVFLIPMPVAMRDGAQTFLQYGSAYCAHGMFRLVRTPFVRDGLIFHLPGNNNLRVAPECSGIHSTWILLITSLLAGYLFLKAPWKRVALAAFVLPLALLRNGFRVFTIGELCVHISPKMIDSPIHHQGGPLFFALSLIPFFLLLAWLRRSERSRPPSDLQT